MMLKVETRIDWFFTVNETISFLFLIILYVHCINKLEYSWPVFEFEEKNCDKQ